MWPQEFIWFFAIFHQEFRGIHFRRDTLLPQLLTARA